MKRVWFLIISATILILTVIFAGILLCFPINRWGPRAFENVCSANMTRIAGALHAYQLDNDGKLPPAYLCDASGKPAHSWRVLLLKYLDKPLYESYRFEEPWDGPNNRGLLHKKPDVYCCLNLFLKKGKLKDPFTNYVAVVGENSAFPGKNSKMLNDVFIGTVLIAEVSDFNIHWTEPRDLDADQINRSPPSTKNFCRYLNSEDPSGPLILFGDLKYNRISFFKKAFDP